MSHIVTIRTEVRDREAVDRACSRLGLAKPIVGEAKVFTASKKGLLIRLAGWEFPAICDLETGRIEYDVYEGHWGDPARLGEFLQSYAIVKATMEAHKRGYSVVEQPLPDGSIRLVIDFAAEGH